MIVKPKGMKPGSRLAILSPASAAKADLVHVGMDRLRSLGYDPVLSPNALARGPLYYAGSIAQRLDDLHAAFADPTIDGILCTRGGWGSAELLPLLNADLIRANPKVFIGYSDQISLHIWLRRSANLVTFHGPMCAADFSRAGGADAASWSHALHQDAPWSLGSDAGLRILKPGTAEGTLDGGCLSIFVEALGTPYAPLPSDGILLLEDIGTKPYQWDRQLLHLRYAGHLDHVKGIVLGDMTQSVPPEDQPLLEQAILHALRDFSGPIAIGLRSGHVAAQNITLPLGINVRLDLTDQANPRLHFLEAAVTV